VHFVGLVNVLNLKAGGLGNLGTAQLDWLKRDLAGRSASTPIVVFAHIPLWTVYPDWGWGTDDSEQALALLRRFGSVTVLNGHIHQVMQKVEGNVAFHTAMSTAFPQPAPGTAPSPGPLTVEPARLRSLLGLASVTYHQGQHALAIVDSPLGAAPGGPAAPSAVPRREHAAAAVVADGLSALAVARQAPPLVEAIRQQAPPGWQIGPVVVARQARVALGDEVGALLGARLVAVLIGERPGLSSPDSLGIYLTWRPQLGRSDAERNCISNIRPEGLPYEQAATRLRYLMTEARRRRLSGVALKDESGALRG